MAEYQVEIPGTPPSLNKIGSRGSHWATTKAKKEWEGHLMIGLLHAKVPKRLDSVRATAVLTFKSNRRRDEGNYRWLLEKALGDVLQKGGWLEDDTPDHYTFGSLTFSEETGEAMTVVTIEAE